MPELFISQNTAPCQGRISRTNNIMDHLLLPPLQSGLPRSSLGFNIFTSSNRLCREFPCDICLFATPLFVCTESSVPQNSRVIFLGPECM
jgi:hypothetical protein